MSISINELSNEIFENIFLFMDDKELTKCLLVCKRWQANITTIVRYQELKGVKKQIAANLIELSSQLSSSAIESYEKDAYFLIINFYNINKIEDIRSKSIILKTNIDEIASSYKLMGRVTVDKIVDSFLKADLFDRALEEIAKSPEDEWDNAHVSIIKYMLEKKFAPKDIAEKFKEFSSYAQEIIFYQHHQIIDTNQMHLFLECISQSYEKDFIVTRIFNRFLKEDKIDFKKINLCMHAMCIDEYKAALLYKALWNLSKKESIDLNVVKNISNLFKKLHLNENFILTQPINNLMQDIENKTKEFC